MAPTVSVIIPTWNRESIVVEAIDSVLAQTSGDLELLVVDDGSTDATGAAVAARRDGDSRISYRPIDHTGCPGAVRNRGVEAASGRLVAFLDSDDLWLPTKLERQVPLFDKGTTTLCHTGERWIRNGREVSQSHRKHRRSGRLFEEALVKCLMAPSTVMIDRRVFESVGGFREDIEIAEDYELWLRLTDRYEVAYFAEELTVRRAGHAGQLSERYGHIELFRIEALRRLVDDHAFSADHLIAARRELARKCRIYASGARRRGRAVEADEYDAFAGRYGSSGPTEAD